MSGREEDLRKSLKALYDDLCDAENKQEKEPFGFTNRLKVIYENYQDLEMKICNVFGLGEFGVLLDFEPNHYRLGDSGMDQMLKTQIKQLAIEIGVNLEQENTISENTSDETLTKHHWTNKEETSRQSSNEEPLDVDVIREEFVADMQVFISHKFVKADQKLAIHLETLLKEHNLYGYIAERKKEYEKPLSDKIKSRIQNSHYLVAILTKHSFNSHSVNQEIGYALGLKIPVLLMAEKGQVPGVLVQGYEHEEFSRENFSKPCSNIVNYIIDHGKLPRISDKEKQELLEKVYSPCYDQLMNIFQKKEFIQEVPPNPWKEKITHTLRLKTEPEMVELFENYSTAKENWHNIFIERENDFFHQEKKLADIIKPAFEQAKSLDQNNHVILNEKSTIEIGKWLHTFRFVIFDPSIKDASTLHNKLSNHSKITKSAHERWLDDFSAKTDFFRYLVKILPKLRESFETKVANDELFKQQDVLKKSLEKLIYALEEKLK